MRAMRAEEFSGYEGLKLVDLPKPAVWDGKVLVRMAAAGVTPLEHTILFGKLPPRKGAAGSRRRRSGDGRGGRRKGLSGRFARDVHGAARRFRGWGLQ
jgi:hypothetical protein